MRPASAAAATGFAALLRAHRRTAGLTQHELARSAGTSVAAIRDLEQGRTLRPRAASVTRISGALGLDMSQAQELARAARAPAWRPGWPIDAAHRTARGGGQRPAAPSAGLWLQVLGPVLAWHDGAPVPLGPPRQRAVLGLLALSPGTPVHRETIIDALWGDAPPVTAVNAVQAYVGRLRRALGTARPGTGSSGHLVTTGGGYQLRVTGGQLDVLAFEQSADHARAACSANDLELSCRLFETALGWWRADPLADLDLLRGHPAVAALVARRAVVVSEYAQAASSVGWYDRVLPHLRALTARDPLDEKAHALLMIALAGSGQQAAALRVYEDIRRQLDDQLGVRPGPELSAAHLRVLRQDLAAADRARAPSLRAVTVAGHSGRAAAHPRPPVAAAAPVPRQLPPAAAHFAGRAGELKLLSGLLDQSVASGGMRIVAISGTAGVGKTTLAVQWAHQVAGRFPDGQLYVNLRGFDPSGTPVAAAEAIRGFLDAFGVPVERIPVGLEAQCALYRSLTAGRRMLVVLDNARGAGQVRPLLPGGRACQMVVTSRDQLAGLVAAEGAHPLTLDVLSDPDARELLSRRLGRGRVAGEPGAATELIGLCARLPLALAVAAAHAAAHPGLSLGALASRLKNAQARLDRLATGDDEATSVRTVFSWSYRDLTGPAARVFRLLGLHPGPDITYPAAASLAGLPLPQAQQALGELVRACLLAGRAPGRFVLHDLLRAYARELAEAAEGEVERQQALQRMLDHYLHTAHAAAVLVDPNRDRLALAAAAAGVQPERPGSRAEALAWFAAQHQVLLGAVSAAAAAGFDIHAWQIPAALREFFARRGHWRDWAAAYRTALAAARRCGDQSAQALAHRNLGDAYSQLGRYLEARLQLRKGLDLYRQIGNRSGQAAVHFGLTLVAEHQRQYDQGLRHAERALKLFGEMGHRSGEAYALNAVGWMHALLGEHWLTHRYCESALGLHRELGDRFGEGVTLDSLAYARHQSGDHRAAVTLWCQALSLLRAVGDRYYQACILAHLGDAHHATGNSGQARGAWLQALDILDDLGHADAAEVRAKLRPRRDPAPAASHD